MSHKNASRLYLEAQNIMAVANMSVLDLDPFVGKEAGRQIHRFFNTSVFEGEDD